MKYSFSKLFIFSVLFGCASQLIAMEKMPEINQVSIKKLSSTDRETLANCIIEIDCNSGIPSFLPAAKEAKDNIDAQLQNIARVLDTNGISHPKDLTTLCVEDIREALGKRR